MVCECVRVLVCKCMVCDCVHVFFLCKCMVCDSVYVCFCVRVCCVIVYIRVFVCKNSRCDLLLTCLSLTLTPNRDCKALYRTSDRCRNQTRLVAKYALSYSRC